MGVKESLQERLEDKLRFVTAKHNERFGEMFEAELQNFKFTQEDLKLEPDIAEKIIGLALTNASSMEQENNCSGEKRLEDVFRRIIPTLKKECVDKFLQDLTQEELKLVPEIVDGVFTNVLYSN